MQKMILAVFLVIVLSLTFVNFASADHGEPIGSCAPAFELHHMMDHMGDPMHVHIGLDRDLNGDGYLCVRHISAERHLHIDNFLP